MHIDSDPREVSEMRRYGSLIGLAILFCLMPAFFGDAATPERKDGKMTILFTHDLHSHFLSDRVPKPGGGQAVQGGYARLARLIGQEREKVPGRSLLVDAGDIAMGTLFHTEFREEALELRLMGEMGYDAATLGNHDYEFHPAGLAAMLRTSRSRSGRLPLLVASNVMFTQDDPRDAPLKAAFTEYPVTQYAVLERNGIRIGLFGIMGREAAEDNPFAAPVTFADIMERSKVLVDLLRNKEKVDLVVCLSHAGTQPVKSRSEDEILAGKVPGIDVIISGHSHTVLPEPIRIGRTIIVSAGSYGAYLGVLNMDISREAGARVASYRLEKVSAEIAEDPGIAKKIEAFKGIVERRYLIYSGNRHDQVIAETAFDMPSPAYRQGILAETGLGDLITDAFRFAVRQAEGENYRYVHIAVTADGIIRDTFLTGGITVADAFKVLSPGLGMDDRAGHPLITFYLTGEELRRMLEVQTSIAPIKHGAQLQISGVRFTFNPNRIPFDRVVSVAVQGEGGTFQPLRHDKLYRVCANAYMAGMLNFVRRASHGLIQFTPKDDKGMPVTDWKPVRVDADAGAAGIQELKEWVALTLYLKSLPDRNGNGVPDLPERYRNPDGRNVAVPSWNPADLLRGAGWITWAVLAAAALLLVVLALIVWWIVRLARRRAKG
jgi:5'-nucleotidase/UDP-sugar diphosphatase